MGFHTLGFTPHTRFLTVFASHCSPFVPPSTSKAFASARKWPGLFHPGALLGFSLQGFPLRRRVVCSSHPTFPLAVIPRWPPFARVRRNTVRRRSSEKRARSASGFCLPSESVHRATRCYPCGPVDPLLGFLLLRVLSKRTIDSFESPLLRFVGELRRGFPQVRSSPNRAL